MPHLPFFHRLLETATKALRSSAWVILVLSIGAAVGSSACSRDGEAFGRLPANRTAVHNTQFGQLVGEHVPAREDLDLPGIDIYRGIAYAAPPVGPLRWQPPQNPEPWEGVRDAIAFGPRCPQPHEQDPTEENPPTFAEDCLTLNIWTSSGRSGRRPNPTIVRESRPVFVWIHGGAFLLGSGSVPRLDGSRFVVDGAVLVTINYRLGALGFLAHPELLAEQPATNFGLLDMQHALLWVRNHIQDFGGDNNNVTIIGEAAGGMAVQLLMATKAKLFEQAISMSGYGTWPLPRVPSKIPKGQHGADANPFGNRAKAPILSATLIGDAIISRAFEAAGLERSIDLRELPIDTLVGAVNSLHLPIVDGTSLLDEPALIFARGAQAQVPFLAGGNSYDGAVMAMANLSPEIFFSGWGNWQEDLRELYADDFAISADLGASRLFGDGRYLLASRRMARDMRNVRQPGYLYYYDWIPEQHREEWPGAHHTSEIHGLFSAPTVDPPDEATKKVGQALRKLFLEFARLRKPAGEEWPPYTEDGDTWFLIGRDGTVGAKTGLLKDKLDFLEKRYEERVAAQDL